jgi:hypothetical protein
LRITAILGSKSPVQCRRHHSNPLSGKQVSASGVADRARQKCEDSLELRQPIQAVLQFIHCLLPLNSTGLFGGGYHKIKYFIHQGKYYVHVNGQEGQKVEARARVAPTLKDCRNSGRIAVNVQQTFQAKQAFAALQCRTDLRNEVKRHQVGKHLSGQFG